MVRSVILGILLLVAGISCSRPEQRAARYNPDQCPTCQGETQGQCTYCNGTKECMYCKGEKQRTVVVPRNLASGIKSSTYKEACPYCHGTGVCTYCKGSGLCWVCEGSGKVISWDFLISRPASKGK